MINSINEVRSVQTISAVKPEAVQAGQPDETTQVQQNSAGKTANLPQAVLVALENSITTGLSEISQTVANRTALIKSLPPEIRELVQQLVSQNQAAQITLPEGLVTLLKSSKTGAEKLAMLADIIEQAAGFTAEEGQGPDAKQLVQTLLQQEEPASQAGQTKSNQQNPSTQQILLTDELDELTQTIANRTSKSLPPETRQPVQQLLSQNQATQTSLPADIVALLKSLTTRDEKTAVLADSIDGQGEASAPEAAGKQQLQSELAAAFQGKNPGDLQEMAKVLRQLAARSNVPGNNQDMQAASQQSDGLTSQLSEKTAVAVQPGIVEEQAELAPANKSPNQRPEAKQSEMPQRQDNSANNSQNLSAKSAMPAGNAGKSQELAQLLKAFTTQPELAENLPPEIRKIVLTLLQQEEPGQNQAGQTTLPEAGEGQRPGAKLQMPQRQDNSANNSQNLSAKPAMPAGNAGKSQELAQLLKAFTTQPELAESLPPEIRKIVLTLLQQEEPGQDQAGQTTLPEAREGQGASIKQSQMPQRQDNSANNSQDLSTKPAMPAGNAGKSQELAQLLKAFTTQPELAESLPPEIRKIVLTLLQQEESGQDQAGRTTLPEAREGQEASIKQSQMPQRQDNPANNSQDLSTKPAMPAGNTGKSQELAQLLKAFTTQPELAESLPPEIRKIVLTLLQQDEPASTTAQATQMPAQTTQTTQTTQMIQNPKLPAQQIPSSTSQPSSPTQTAQASSPQAGQLMQTLPAAVAELVTALKKTQQAPIDKIIVFANILEQAAELLTPKQPQAAQSFGLSQQAMVELANIWREKSPEEVKAAINVVRELAETMSKPSGATAERQDAQRILTIAVPLYFGDGQTVYPAYIHVYYQEEEDKKNPGQKVTETWLRICLETENIGMVDAAFRLYDGNNLDVKVRFTDAEAASGFANCIQEVKEQLGQLPLTLGEFLVK